MEDLTGVKFGKYTVIERKSVVPDLWLCECECGRHRRMGTDLILLYIRRGENPDCGVCRFYHFTLEDQKIRRRYFMVLSGMKNRCYNKNNPAYKDYGGRGITICDEWRNNFKAFYEYVSKLEHFNEPGRSLDRIDNDKGYCPGNVRWATAIEQVHNQRPRKKRVKNGEQDKRCPDQGKQQV